jgi:aspartokinase
MLIEERDLKHAERVLANAKKGVVDRVETTRDVALLCLVGEGLGQREGIAAKIFSIVAINGTNVGLISAGASTTALTFTVKRKDLDKTTQMIHHEFFGG